jgi:hypothetical protein
VSHQKDEDLTHFTVATGERRGQDIKINGVKKNKRKG